MTIMIAYATYSSGTETASTALANTLQSLGQTVTVKRISGIKPEELESFDLIIFASPSWEDHGRDGQPHVDFLAAFERFADHTYAGKRFAVMGLGDMSYAHFCGAVTHIENWVKKMQGQLAVPSLRIDSFYFEQEANTNRVTEWGQALMRTLQHPK